MTSRAVQYRSYGGPEVLEVVDREDPAPGPGRVRVAVRAASVNPIDTKMRSGAFAGGADLDAPKVPGQDFAGTVAELGEGVTAFAVGDEVLGHAIGGAYAEQALARPEALVAKPAEVSWELAAALPVVTTTAFRVLALLGLGDGEAAGQTLLVDGASGGVGIAVVQIALARGATVVGTASEANHDYLRSLGAIPVAYGEGLVARVRAATPQIDKALDVSGRGSLTDLIALTSDPDDVVTIASGDAEELGVHFSTGGAEEVPAALASAVALVADGRLRIDDIRTYPLDEAAAAQAEIETGHVRGKLVLRIV